MQSSSVSGNLIWLTMKRIYYLIYGKITFVLSVQRCLKSVTKRKQYYFLTSWVKFTFGGWLVKTVPYHNRFLLINNHIYWKPLRNHSLTVYSLMLTFLNNFIYIANFKMLLFGKCLRVIPNHYFVNGHISKPTFYTLLSRIHSNYLCIDA